MRRYRSFLRTVVAAVAALAVGAGAAFGFVGTGGRPVSCRLNGRPGNRNGATVMRVAGITMTPF